MYILSQTELPTEGWARFNMHAQYIAKSGLHVLWGDKYHMLVQLLGVSVFEPTTTHFPGGTLTNHATKATAVYTL